MKHRTLLIVLALSLALNLGVVSTIGCHWLARRHHGRGGNGGPEHLQRFHKTLNLSDEQAQVLEQRRRELRDALAPLQSRLRAKKLELLSLVKTTDTYTPSIDTLVNQTADIQREMEKKFTQHSLEIRKVLTPEQRQKFDTVLEKRFRKTSPGPGPATEKSRF